MTCLDLRSLLTMMLMMRGYLRVPREQKGVVVGIESWSGIGTGRPGRGDDPRMSLGLRWRLRRGWRPSGLVDAVKGPGIGREGVVVLIWLVLEK